MRRLACLPRLSSARDAFALPRDDACAVPGVAAFHVPAPSACILAKPCRALPAVLPRLDYALASEASKAWTRRSMPAVRVCYTPASRAMSCPCAVSPGERSAACRPGLGTPKLAMPILCLSRLCAPATSRRALAMLAIPWRRDRTRAPLACDPVSLRALGRPSRHPGHCRGTRSSPRVACRSNPRICPCLALSIRATSMRVGRCETTARAASVPRGTTFQSPALPIRALFRA